MSRWTDDPIEYPLLCSTATLDISLKSDQHIFPIVDILFSSQQLLTTYILCFIQLLTRINLNAARCDRCRTVQKYIQSVCWI